MIKLYSKLKLMSLEAGKTLKKDGEIGLYTNWTISKARNTYGYNVCTLRWGNKKIGSCNGGGYDMTGTVIGQFIQDNFQYELSEVDTSSFWCVNKSSSPITVDGACGLPTMEKLLKLLGYNISTGERKNGTLFKIYTC